MRRRRSIIRRTSSSIPVRGCSSSIRNATFEHVKESGALPPAVVRFDSPGADGLAHFEARGAEVRLARPELPAAYEATLLPDDLAVLIYTSGTTGLPKGVMLSHDNLGFDAQVSLACGFEGIEAGRDALSVLPYSHIYEHTIIYIYLVAKVRYFICHDPVELLHDLRDVRPTTMTAVPRIFDRVLAGVMGQARSAGGLQAKLVPWALAVAARYASAKTFGPRGVAVARHGARNGANARAQEDTARARARSSAVPD